MTSWLESQKCILTKENTKRSTDSLTPAMIRVRGSIHALTDKHLNNHNTTW